MFEKISENDERLCTLIVDSAFIVHKNLGPGLLESIYETCFCHELKNRNLKFTRQITVPLKYDGILFETGLRLDVLVEDKIICELKAVNENSELYHAQILSYLKLTKKRLGFLINFNVPLIKNGIKRIIL